MPSEKKPGFERPCVHMDEKPGHTDVSYDKAVMGLSALLPGLDWKDAVAVKRALDWLLSLKKRLDESNKKLGAVKAVPFTSGCADSDGKIVPGTEVAKLMFYNTDVISDDGAMKLLSDGRQELDPRVVVLWPQEAVALFPALHDADEKGEDGKDD